MSKCRSYRRRGQMTQTGPLFPIPFSRIPTNRNPPPNAAQNHAAGPPRGRCTSPHHDSSGTMEGESNWTAKLQRQQFLHKLHKLTNTNPTQHCFQLQLEICIGGSTKITTIRKEKQIIIRGPFDGRGSRIFCHIMNELGNLVSANTIHTLPF